MARLSGISSKSFSGSRHASVYALRPCRFVPASRLPVAGKTIMPGRIIFAFQGPHRNSATYFSLNVNIAK